MSHDAFEVLSNQAVAACAVVYFLAVLAHLWQWALLRRVAPAQVSAQVPAMAAAGGGSDDAPAPVLAAGGADEERAGLFGRIGVALTVVAVTIHFVAVISRGLAANPVRVPWGNMYEFTLTATFVVGLAYLLLYRKFDLDWLSPVVTAFILITLMVDVLLLYSPVVPLRDALQSPWLVIHVVAAILATGAFTIGGMASALYLIKERWPHSRPGGFIARLPQLEGLDRLAYRTHAFAFPVWTFAALIAGPIWAQHAWGKYWNWDPKEVWAFITWVVYAAYLHARATAGWKGKAAAIVALIGLATLWFNFIGINFFFGSGSMHSYA
ncbi:c-type cytochrome biogenesis protein CcsB [Nocardioides terrisoli]|uniref:c-type cytochrome biogenesis protein CcsB n=1 Tax=Nocardioides terrisoli TaxID=3388267 RepID=UPI00287B8F34|nr:c-type cytochrome biogenesis protein CcsB [Nocardioides marmorisolisilvae]